MSIQVPPHKLAETLRGYGSGYLITVGGDGKSHVVAVAPVLDGDRLRVPDLGRRTLGNLAGNPAVTLLWPPRDPGGHSLIVDGQGALDGELLAVTPTRAVLHRPAPEPAAAAAPAAAPGACPADCIPLKI
ncbi:hypothetical protein GCM10023321_66080 [Pseudonocardia eucalypti]|uniref:Pyridoxamine 5'-phosphate oxidase putative domain-containing protein n=1 Tax=Pseudonocardia eucalypti TaxID=648755 RepID=A0ABP9R092_9PSEU|nr:hypothetical protein [Pseudonocardia eucalypti]